MITFLIGAMVGAVVGIGTMCFLAVASHEDEWMESADRKAKLDKMQEPRCSFCGGKLSEIRTNTDGTKYRYCFGCFHEYEVGGCHRRLR